MQVELLVATPSEYRRAWYESELLRHGFSVEAVKSGLECVERLRGTHPNVLLMESCIQRCSAASVLSAREMDERLSQIPVVLVALDGVSKDVYRLASYSVQGFFDRLPSARELATCVQLLVRDSSAHEYAETFGSMGRGSIIPVCSSSRD